MARRPGKAYQNVREIHFLCAAVLAGFVFFYAVSSLVMGYEEWLPKPERETRSTFELAEPAPDGPLEDAAARAWAEAVAASHGVRGRFGRVAYADGLWTIELSRPARKDRLSVRAGSRDVERVHVLQGPVQLLNRFHQLRGFDGPLSNRIWSVMIDVVSIAMIVFSLSGIYMWWVTHRDLLGFGLLFAGTAWVVGSVLVFWL